MSDTITITGNIATEPERRGSGGTPIASFRLASTQRRIDNESGKWVDSHTNWYTVSAFRQLAVHALQSLHKGQRVIVTGRLKVRTWENASGKGTSVDIDAEAIGHDLLWGTTEFRKDDPVESTTAAAPVTEWAVTPTGGEDDAWSTPMSSPLPSEQPVLIPTPAARPATVFDEGEQASMPAGPELAYAGEEAPF